MPSAASSKSHRGKAHEEDDGEAIVGQDIVPNLIEGLWLVERDLGVDGVDCGCDAFGHGGWIFRGPHSDRSLRPGNLPEGDGDLGVLFAEAAAADVVINADNLPLDGGPSLVTPGISCSTPSRCLSGSVPLRNLLTKSSLTMATLTLEAVSCSLMKRPVINLNAEGLEVVRRHHLEARAGPLRWIGSSGFAGDRERHAEIGALAAACRSSPRRGRRQGRRRCCDRICR